MMLKLLFNQVPRHSGRQSNEDESQCCSDEYRACCKTELRLRCWSVDSWLLSRRPLKLLLVCVCAPHTGGHAHTRGAHTVRCSPFPLLPPSYIPFSTTIRH